MCDANVYHFAAMLKKFIPVLDRRIKKSGLIITSSIAALTPLANNAVYNSTKVFESNLCKAIQEELCNSKVDLLLTEPSYVRTALLEKCRAPSVFVATTSQTVKASLNCLGHDKQTHGALIHELKSGVIHFTF